MEPIDNGQDSISRQRRRLRGFGIHLIGYFVVMAVLAGINLTTDPETPWFVLPLVGWGSVLALHTAWAMGLFDVFTRRD